MKARAARRLPSLTALESVRPRGFVRVLKVDPRLLKQAPGWFEISLYYGLPTCTIYPEEITISQHYNFQPRYMKTQVEQTGAVRCPDPGRKFAAMKRAFENPAGVKRFISSDKVTSNGEAARPACLAPELKQHNNYWANVPSVEHSHANIPSTFSLWRLTC